MSHHRTAAIQYPHIPCDITSFKMENYGFMAIVISQKKGWKERFLLRHYF